MSITKLEIVLENPEHIFSSGEIVAGRIILDLNRPKTIKGLTVKVQGQANVSWSETTGSGNHNSTRNFSKKEDYFNNEFCVLGMLGGENVNIEAGHYEFPFRLCLPHNIPSSFETPTLTAHQIPDGSIRYTIDAEMHRPWKFNLNTSRSIAVKIPYDLGQCTTAMTAIDDEDYKTFCCFPFNKSRLKVQTSLPSSGFTIGETIQININIDNQSRSVDVTKIKLQLEQVVKLHSKLPPTRATTKTRTDIVQSVKKNGPFEKKDGIVLSMEIPSLPYSNMVYCNIIDIEYQVNVIMSFTGCHRAMQKKYPIVIGSRLPSCQRTVENETDNLEPTPTAPFFTIERTNASNAHGHYY